ncbi:unnamed protein product [Pedinophyceae sp. YPF-701]|nr:unnamed protein product [Pedinophyceae sp. YPF-701]
MPIIAGRRPQGRREQLNAPHCRARAPARRARMDALAAYGSDSSDRSSRGASPARSPPRAAERDPPIPAAPRTARPVDYGVHVYCSVPSSDAVLHTIQDKIERLHAGPCPSIHTLEPGPDGHSLPSGSTSLVRRRAERRGKAIGGTTAYHLSLCRPCRIKYSQIEDVLFSLRHALHSLKHPSGPARNGAAPGVYLTMGEMSTLTGGDNPREFLVVKVDAGAEWATSAIRRVDAALVLHELPRYHREPVPHVSVAWVPGEEAEALRREVRPGGAAAGSFADWGGESEHGWTATVDRIMCRVGITDYRVWPWEE